MVTPAANPLIRLFKGIVLALLVGLVLEVIWFGIVLPASNGTDPIHANYSAEPPTIVPMAGREMFDESVERALFSWNRRPKVQEEQPVSEEGQLSQWHLTGVVNTGSATYAIFSDESGNHRLRLEQGMYLEKWRLETITAEEVTLSDGEDTEVFYLQETGQQQKALKRRARKEAQGDQND